MTSHLPDLDALRLLVAVGTTGSIGAAAREVGVTQQAASERIRTAEAQVGVTLLRRTTRGSELTEAGVVVAGWARRLLDLAEEVESAIEGLRDDRGRELTVWSSLTVAESLLPRWLVLLRRRQTEEGTTPTTVGFTAANSSAVVEAVAAGTAQLGFVEGSTAPRGVSGVPVASDELVLVVAPGLPLGRRRTPLEPGEVAALALAAREQGSGTREVLERALRAHRLTPAAPEVELTTSTAIRETVASGGPPAFLSRRAVAHDVELGRLTVVPTAGLELHRTFRAIWAGSSRPPAGPARELVAIAQRDTAADARGARE